MRISRKKLAALMIDKDINVNALSERSCVSRVTVSSIRTGKSCAKETVGKIARALGVDPAELLETEVR